MKKFWLALGLAVAGCSSTPTAQPNFINGYYFMAGDPECAFSSPHSSNQIMCYNQQRQPTGYRDAMTSQQLMMFQTDKIVAAQRRPVRTTCSELGGTTFCNSY